MSNTSLLTLQSNGKHNNSTFKDESNFNNIITRTGNATTGTFSPYGDEWSTLFDGTGTFVLDTIPLATSGEFTIEFWMYTTYYSTTNSQWIYTQRGNGTASTRTGVVIDSGKIALNNASDNTFVSSTVLDTYRWYHIAITRDASNIGRIFIDGVLDVQKSFTVSILQDVGKFGYLGNSNNYYYKGYLSNFRIVSGVCLYTSAFTPSESPLEAVSGTTILTFQSNRFIDTSANASLTPAGGVTVQKFSPFKTATSYDPTVHGGSMYFDGSGDYLSLSNAAAIGSGSFTMECWVYLAGTPSVNYWIYGYRNGADTSPYLFINSSRAPVFGGDVTTYLTGSAMPLNAWTHVVVVRNGTAMTMYQNGVSTATTTSSQNFSYTGANYIGQTNGASAYNYLGYISDFRIVVGTPVYTSAFTPPTAPVTPLLNTTLLLNGASSGGIIDASRTVGMETGADVKAVNGVSPYNGNYYSNYFDGTGDYLSVPNNTAFNLGSDNFTMECWVNYNALPSSGSIYSFGGLWNSNGNYSHLIGLNNNSGTYRINLYYTLAGTPVITLTVGDWTPIIGTWYHVAVVRSGSTVTAYINGTSIGSASLTSTFHTSSTIYTVGSAGADGHAINGNISNFRLVKGTAIYTSNFTPPTSPLTAVSGTSLLTCQSNKFIDNSTNNFTITKNGDTKVVTQNPFQVNTGLSYYFDGTGDYIKSNSPTTFGTGDFTIECWFYAEQTATYQGLFETRPSGANGLYPLLMLNNSSVVLYVSSANRLAAEFSLFRWHHVAVCRVNGTSTLYLDGVATGSTYADTNNYISRTDPLIGCLDTVSNFFKGYISDLRITKSARYTANFTPPTEPLKLK